MGNKGLGTVADQEVTIAEAPEDTDTGKAGIAGGLDIDIAIADVDGRHPTPIPSPQGAGNLKKIQGGEDGIRGGLATDTGSLILTNGDLDGVGEEMVAELLGGCHHFVADHSQVTATGFESGQSLRNTFVRTGGVEGMRHVILAEGGEGLVKTRIVGAIGNGTLHQFTDAIAHEPAYIVKRMFRHTMRAEGVIDRSRQIAYGIEQRTVEIEDICAVTIHFYGCGLSSYVPYYYTYPP